MTTYVVDANLIVLLVVGSYDISIVADRRHRRCREFDVEDFAILDGLLQAAEGVVCTPFAMAEASNLVRLVGEPLRTALTAHFGLLIPNFREGYSPSVGLIDDNSFVRLGLTDVSLLAVAEDREVLTTDLDLYLAAVSRGCRATNFVHLRDMS